MEKISSFLITVALIAGMVGCAGGESYALAIASTEGGSVTTPGEGMFTYGEGTVVNLTAEAEEGYHFVNWTGNVGTIANVNAASTTITMNGHYSITANFAVEPMVAAGYSHTVGLKSNGRVVAVGRNDEWQCNVAGWTGITQVATGYDLSLIHI